MLRIVLLSIGAFAASFERPFLGEYLDRLFMLSYPNTLQFQGKGEVDSLKVNTNNSNENNNMTETFTNPSVSGVSTRNKDNSVKDVDSTVEDQIQSNLNEKGSYICEDIPVCCDYSNFLKNYTLSHPKNAISSIFRNIHNDIILVKRENNSYKLSHEIIRPGSLIKRTGSFFTKNRHFNKLFKYNKIDKRGIKGNDFELDDMENLSENRKYKKGAVGIDNPAFVDFSFNFFFDFGNGIFNPGIGLGIFDIQMGKLTKDPAESICLLCFLECANQICRIKKRNNSMIFTDKGFYPILSTFYRSNEYYIIIKTTMGGYIPVQSTDSKEIICIKVLQESYSYSIRRTFSAFPEESARISDILDKIEDFFYVRIKDYPVDNNRYALESI